MTDLAALAAAYGVATEYENWRGDRVTVPADTVRAVLGAMGASPSSAPPPPHRRGPAADPDARCPGLDGPPAWGWMLQLYALRSARSEGLGDLGDLATLARWTGAAGGDFVLCNPLHAAAPGLPQQDSPYFPSTRRFTNPLYLSVPAVPEAAGLDLPRYDGAAPDRIDRDAAYRHKSAAWDRLHAVPRSGARRRAYEEFRAREGAALDRFATFCALAERHGTPWQRWPPGLRDPNSPEVARAARELGERVDLHRWLQFWCDEQLGAAQQAATGAGMRLGVLHDLAVGVDPGGADAWAMRDDLAFGVTVGAPPDSFNQRGQDWRQPPLRPDRLAETGCAPFRDMLRALLRHAGGVRIDHAVGLFRLFWIPDGATPAEGTYVGYPASDLLGVVAEETARAGAVAVAEDLGTVPAGVPERLRERGFHTSAVLWFGTAGIHPRSLASVTTHDLPTAAGFWRGEATRVRAQLGQLGRDRAEQERADAAERDELRRALGLPADAGDEDLVTAMYAYLGRSPAALLAVSVNDATGDLRQPNLPGTTDEYPSWRLPVADPGGRPVSLEELLAAPRTARLVDAVARARRGGAA